jgi:hypothetical protein
MKRLLWLFALIALPVTALQAMTVAVFLEKADALERRGMTALFSSDLRLLKAEVKSAGQALKAERDRRRASGQRPAYCAPERMKLNSDDLLAHFRSIPPAQRQRMEVRDALRLMLVRRYPCPA